MFPSSGPSHQSGFKRAPVAPIQIFKPVNPLSSPSILSSINHQQPPPYICQTNRIRSREEGASSRRECCWEWCRLRVFHFVLSPRGLLCSAGQMRLINPTLPYQVRGQVPPCQKAVRLPFSCELCQNEGRENGGELAGCLGGCSVFGVVILLESPGPPSLLCLPFGGRVSQLGGKEWPYSIAVILALVVDSKPICPVVRRLGLWSLRSSPRGACMVLCGPYDRCPSSSHGHGPWLCS